MLTIEVAHRFVDQGGEFRLDVNLQTPDSGVTALFGPSGAGKTSLLRIVAGLLKADFANVRVGESVLCDKRQSIWLPPERRRIGYVFQDARLFPHLSVTGNLRYGRRFNPPAESGSLGFDAVVELLGLGPLLKRSVHRLSGGETQRVAIGRALLSNPQLLLLDEPLAALDGQRKAEILPYLDNLRHAAALPILYVSHSLAEIRRLASWMAVLDNGAVSAFGSVEDVTGRIDLPPLVEGGDGGTVLSAVVTGHDRAHAITKLSVAGQTLLVTRLDMPEGTQVRVQVRPQDITIALERPERISALNILEGKITALHQSTRSTKVDISINIGTVQRPVNVWAQVTKLAVERLEMRRAMPVFALIKAVSLDGDRVGLS